ncbi:MAG: hypothetical protein QUS35_02195 [bacterium]|nr:hypothetical protein [bacterium]
MKRFIVMMFCVSVMALTVMGCAKKAEEQQPAPAPAPVDSAAAVVDSTAVAQ